MTVTFGTFYLKGIRTRLHSKVKRIEREVVQEQFERSRTEHKRIQAAAAERKATETQKAAA